MGLGIVPLLVVTVVSVPVVPKVEVKLPDEFEILSVDSLSVEVLAPVAVLVAMEDVIDAVVVDARSTS